MQGLQCCLANGQALFAGDLCGNPVGFTHKIGHKAALRITINLFGRANLLDHAMVHHHNPVGHGQRLVLIVRHQNSGNAQPLLQAADFAA